MRDRLLLASRWLAWCGVWLLHACVLLRYPLWDAPGACLPALQRAALHCGWVCAAARLSRHGLPVGLAGMAAFACASPAIRACAGPSAWNVTAHAAPRVYPAGCAAAGIAAILAGLRAARKRKPGAAEDEAEPAAASAWHPLGEPAL